MYLLLISSQISFVVLQLGVFMKTFNDLYTA